MDCTVSDIKELLSILIDMLIKRFKLIADSLLE